MCLGKGLIIVRQGAPRHQKNEGHHLKNVREKKGFKPAGNVHECPFISGPQCLRFKPLEERGGGRRQS